MSSAADRLANLGVQIPEIFLPNKSVDLERWAVIACDQHTSEPAYWNQVEEFVGESPSSLHLIFPEVYLEGSDAKGRIAHINQTMRDYLEKNTVASAGETMILTRRSTPHANDRRGLLLSLDLDRYDYRPGSHSLIRATEETIEARLPPRVRIREDAVLELPHILVLIDDPEDRLIGSLVEADPERLYQTSLMFGGGTITGHRIDGALLDRVADGLDSIYSSARSESPFLFAMGDGNHSLATAKAVWEREKASGSPNPLARFALVEVVNTYDPGLTFEPIHRLLTGPNTAAAVRTLVQELGSAPRECRIEELQDQMASSNGVGIVTAEGARIVEIVPDTLPVAAVQERLNRLQALSVDYIHGWQTAIRLGREDGNAAVLMPEFKRSLLYPYIEANGVLPRKAFSLGEAEEKRYYLEARRIS